MAVERAPATSSLVDVLERVLDRGIVVDPWVRAKGKGFSLAGRQVRAENEAGRGSEQRPSRRRKSGGA